MESIVISNSEAKSLMSVEIDQGYLNTISCIICGNISKSPVVFNCCQTVACDTCIKKEENCPKCNKEKTKAKLPSQLIKKIFSNLKVKCNYKCEEVLTISNYEEHGKYCVKNPLGLRQCEKCSIYFEHEKLNNHECIKELVRNIEEMKKEIVSIKQNINSDKTINIAARIRHSLKIHKHELVKVTKRGAWNCNTCRHSSTSGSHAYYCPLCDFDCCNICFEYSFSRRNNPPVHNHGLSYKWEKATGFTCSVCAKAMPSNVAQYRCAPCNFIACFSCRFN